MQHTKNRITQNVITGAPTHILVVGYRTKEGFSLSFKTHIYLMDT